MFSQNNHIKRFGRPNGSSIEKKVSEKQNYINMLNYISNEYAENKRTLVRIKDGALSKIIQEASLKFNIHKKISKNTIISRYKRNHIVCAHRGTVTPMSSLEPAILEIFIQMGMMNQPLTVTEGLQLCNSLIKVGSSLCNRNNNNN